MCNVECPWVQWGLLRGINKLLQTAVEISAIRLNKWIPSILLHPPFIFNITVSMTSGLTWEMKSGPSCFHATCNQQINDNYGYKPLTDSALTFWLTTGFIKTSNDPLADNRQGSAKTRTAAKWWAWAQNTVHYEREISLHFSSPAPYWPQTHFFSGWPTASNTFCHFKYILSLHVWTIKLISRLLWNRHPSNTNSVVGVFGERSSIRQLKSFWTIWRLRSKHSTCLKSCLANSDVTYAFDERLIVFHTPTRNHLLKNGERNKRHRIRSLVLWATDDYNPCLKSEIGVGELLFTKKKKERKKKKKKKRRRLGLINETFFPTNLRTWGKKPPWNSACVYLWFLPIPWSSTRCWTGRGCHVTEGKHGGRESLTRPLVSPVSAWRCR